MHRQYKILYLINGLGPGGAENMLYRLLQGLNHKLFTPQIIALLDIPGPLKEKIEELGITVEVINMNSKTDFASLFRLFRAIKYSAPHILHTQLFASDILGRIIGKLIGVPIIITSIRNTIYPGRFRDALIKYTERFSDKTTIVSRMAADRFIADKIIPKEKLLVIHSGVDPQNFYNSLNDHQKMELKKKLELPVGPFLLLSVGSLTAQKGYSNLFSALDSRELRSIKNSFRLIVVGDGPLENELRCMVVRMGLDDQVHFIGRSDSIPELMAAADALVLSSLWEGLPGVVLEAMASELPVVATTVGGVPELIVEGETGFLVQPESPSALAQAIKKIIKMPSEERLRMGRVGGKRVCEYFHSARMVKDYERLYLECIKEKDLQ